MYYLDSHLSILQLMKKKTILTLPPRPVSAESSFLNGGRLSSMIAIIKGTDVHTVTSVLLKLPSPPLPSARDNLGYGS